MIYDEHYLMAIGVPFSEAQGMVRAIRRDIALGRLDKEDIVNPHADKREV